MSSFLFGLAIAVFVIVIGGLILSIPLILQKLQDAHDEKNDGMEPSQGDGE